MAKAAKQQWLVMTEWLGATRFDTLEELLEALSEVGVATEVLRIWDEGVMSRAYTQDGRIIIEAFHPEEFDPAAWLRNPDWHTIAKPEVA